MLVGLTESYDCKLTVDYILGCIRIMGSEAAVAEAVAALERKHTSVKLLRASIRIEAFMIAPFVGKSGAGIQALEAESETHISVSREDMCVYIVGKTAEATQKGIELANQKIEQLKNQYWECIVPEDAIGALLGKGGAVAKKLRSDSGANIDIDSKSREMKVCC